VYAAKTLTICDMRFLLDMNAVPTAGSVDRGIRVVHTKSPGVRVSGFREGFHQAKQRRSAPARRRWIRQLKIASCRTLSLVVEIGGLERPSQVERSLTELTERRPVRFSALFYFRNPIPLAAAAGDQIQESNRSIRMRNQRQRYSANA